LPEKEKEEKVRNNFEKALGDRNAAIFYIVSAAFTFTVLGAGSKAVTNTGMGIAQMAYLRYMLSTPVTWILCEKGEVKIYETNRSLSFWLHLRGFFGFWCNCLWYLTIVLIPLGEAMSLILTSPLWVMLLGVFFLGEKLTKL
jgi:drug/metabolite transporter (DMT)-like permease